MFLSLPVIISAFVIFLIYLYIQQKRTYWLKRNVPSLQQHFLWGNAADLFLGKKSMAAYHEDLYYRIGTEGILGIFMFLKPTLYVNDPSIIQKILRQDFDHFHDRGVTFNVQQEPLTRHLFHLEFDEWKCLKFKLMSTFSSQFVIEIFEHLNLCASELQQFFVSFANASDIEVKHIMNRFTTDVIGKCVFGFTSNALNDPNSEFYKMTTRIFAPRKRMILKLILPNLPNFLVELFDIRFVEKAVSQYFISIIEKEIKKRDEGRNDAHQKNFLNSLLDIRRHELRNTGIDRKSGECRMFYLVNN